MVSDNASKKPLTGSDSIIGHLDGAVGYCQLNRPDARNAMAREMWVQLPELLTELKKQGARVVVIRGAGRNFCAGADLNDLKSIDSCQSAEHQWQPIRDALNFVDAFDLPTIASIEGACLGGGCLLSIACDLRYAETGSYFAIPVAKLGIVLDDASILRLTSLVGVGKAKEMLLTAGTISGAEAERAGLINGTVDSELLDEHVKEVAHKIVENGTASVSASKESMRNIMAKVYGWRHNILGNEKTVIDSYVSDDFKSRISNSI